MPTTCTLAALGQDLMLPLILLIVVGLHRPRTPPQLQVYLPHHTVIGSLPHQLPMAPQPLHHMATGLPHRLTLGRHTAPGLLPMTWQGRVMLHWHLQRHLTRYRLMKGNQWVLPHRPPPCRRIAASWNLGGRCWLSAVYVFFCRRLFFCCRLSFPYLVSHYLP